MAAIGTLPVVLGTGDHASRPAASAVGVGGIYACSDHDLIYQTDGSSWSTWASLTGSAGFTTGTSFPGSPTDNDIVFRTDLDEWFRYEATGTMWLCTNEHVMDWTSRTAFGTSGGISATSTIANAPTLGSLGDMWIKDLFVMARVITTSDGSKFWTITLDKIDAAASATNIGSVSTVSNTADNWVEEKDDIDEIVVGATYKAFRIVATKTSTPGNLEAAIRVTWQHCFDV